MDVIPDSKPIVERFGPLDESKFSIDAFLDRKTGRTPAPEPEPEPEPEPVLDAEPEVVESEPETPAQDEGEEGNLDDGPEESETPETSPEPEPTTLLAGKYKTAADLEQGYKQTSAEASRLAQQLNQLQWELTQAQQAAAKAKPAQEVPAAPPRFELLPEATQREIAAIAVSQGMEPQALLYHDWRLKLAQAEQAQARAEADMRISQERWHTKAQAVSEYCKERLDPLGPAGNAELQAYPEFFEALRALSPEALERVGKRWVDLVAMSLEGQRTKAEAGARETAARRAGREEVRLNRQAKLGIKTEAQRSRTVDARPKTEGKTGATKTNTSTKIKELLEAAGQDRYG